MYFGILRRIKQYALSQYETRLKECIRIALLPERKEEQAK